MTSHVLCLQCTASRPCEEHTFQDRLIVVRVVVYFVVEQLFDGIFEMQHAVNDEVNLPPAGDHIIYKSHNASSSRSWASRRC
jgi:hypothetical protein